MNNNSDVSSANFWNTCYSKNDTGWDLGRPTPIFIDWCNKLTLVSRLSEYQ